LFLAPDAAIRRRLLDDDGPWREAFGSQRSAPDRRHGWCRSCVNADTRARASARSAGRAGDVVATMVPSTVAVIEAVDEHRCVLTSGSDSLDSIALHPRRRHPSSRRRLA